MLEKVAPYESGRYIQQQDCFVFLLGKDHLFMW